MTTTYSTQTLNGVPYWVDSEHHVFLYGSSPPVLVGTLQNKELHLNPTWLSSSTPFLHSYRQRMGELTETLLEANPQQSKN
jgi:hypothetical protein